MSFLKITEQHHPGRKTKVFLVESTSGVPLGEIYWNCAWRRYCFFPNSMTLFDYSCLQEIAEFIRREMDAREV